MKFILTMQMMLLEPLQAKQESLQDRQESLQAGLIISRPKLVDYVGLKNLQVMPHNDLHVVLYGVGLSINSSIADLKTVQRLPFFVIIPCNYST
ncbi:hypothetical protein BT93_A0104 [Corymbia citriodora subsp. variegata]|nr:hypothetical protein BT93_A0104 [Corymbia citriodora subsp. variegata]